MKKPIICKDWKNYIAQLILQYHVEDDPRVLTQINAFLIHADSAEEALKKAKKIADDSYQYRNSDGKVVTVTYKGIYDIDIVQNDELSSGELLSTFQFEDGIGIEADEIVVQEKDLSIFTLSSKTSLPNIDQ